MKNVNNWKLIGIFALMAIVFIGVRIFRSPLRESNMPHHLTEIDSARVSELIVLPARERDGDIHLVRNGKKWELRKGNRVAHLEQGAAQTALASLMNLQPRQFVTRKKEKWNEFAVGDSTGTNVRVMIGDETEADVWIGRTGFSQNSGGGFSGGFTYVRLQDSKEVYTVESFLEGQFNRGFNDWRDKTFTRLKRDSVDRILFHYPADSSFTIEKKNNRWMSGNVLADSASVMTYLNGLEYKNMTAFADGVPVGDAPAYIVFEHNAKALVKIDAWPSTGVWILRSSHQPDTYFSTDGQTAIKDVWKGKDSFSPKAK